MVGLPYGKLKDLQPVTIDATTGDVYPPPNSGLLLQGQRVYREQGCYQCHTQVVRPTYAGPDRWRKGWAGETPRETHPMDYYGLPIAMLGVQRIGPDLANVGYRVTDAKWHYKHLYAPRSINDYSVMPAFTQLFTKRKIDGQPSVDAVDVADLPEGYEVVPTPDARALVTYLLALRKDSPTAAPTAAPAP